MRSTRLLALIVIPVRACLLALAVLCIPAMAAEPPPASVFFDNPVFGTAQLSPDGRSLAVLVNNNNGRDRLAVVNLADNAIKVVAEFADGDVGNFQWVNNERLLYDSKDRQTATGDLRYAPGLFAVNRDGSGMRRLAELRPSRTPSRGVLPWHTFMLNQRGAQDSDAVYVTSHDYGLDRELKAVHLLRLDTVTGHATAVKRHGPVRSWLLDAKGEPRIATTLEANQSVVYYIDPAGGAWRKLASFDTYLGGSEVIRPLGFAPDGTLYVTSQRGDKLSLSAYDLAANRLKGEPLVQLEEYDFRGNLIKTQDRLLGVRYLSDASATAWFDPAMKAAQEAVDKLLPNTVNLLDVAPRSQTPWILVRSASDRQPAVLTLFNRETGKLSMIGETRPRVDPARMATQELVLYKARDGLTVPAWMTTPDGGKGKKLPLVLLVHDGPWERGNAWGWNADAQFLASRGYAVLEPEYRGSTGFGMKHFSAGWKQWGLAMQDDLADGARWAIEQGIADPQRICIAGGGYGGYATLMGLIRDPGLYKCGINFFGVTDIKLMYTGHWSALSSLTENYKQYGMPALIGDPVKDADQLAATSPLVHAARVTRPLLMAYGGVDRRVPIYHGKKFLDAVKQTNKDVEWVVYDDEGHGWSLTSTRVDFWGRVEKFLNRNIGTP